MTEVIRVNRRDMGRYVNLQRVFEEEEEETSFFENLDTVDFRDDLSYK